MTLIYLLEDDADIRRIIERTLAQYGMDVQSFRQIGTLTRALRARRPDLCLIDLGLPDGDASVLLGPGAVAADVPRIVVTGRGDAADRIVGLERGADDYIVKPFDPREMVARINAVLRRARPAPEPQAGVQRFSGWSVDFDRCIVTHDDGAEVALSYAEASLLAALARAPGRVQTRAQLLEATTGRSEDPTDRSMDARISRLRKKLRDDPYSPNIIRTVYGAGYLFSG